MNIDYNQIKIGQRWKITCSRAGEAIVEISEIARVEIIVNILTRNKAAQSWNRRFTFQSEGWKYILLPNQNHP